MKEENENINIKRIKKTVDVGWEYLCKGDNAERIFSEAYNAETNTLNLNTISNLVYAAINKQVENEYAVHTENKRKSNNEKIAELAMMHTTLSNFISEYCDKDALKIVDDQDRCMELAAREEIADNKYSYRFQYCFSLDLEYHITVFLRDTRMTQVYVDCAEEIKKGKTF